MTPSEAAKMRAELSNGLLEMSEQMQPMIDAAEGMKKKMEESGWSPTAAETAALTWLVGMMQQAFKV